MLALVMSALVLVVGYKVVAQRHGIQLRSTDGCRSSAPRLSVLLIGNSLIAENDLAGTLASVICKSGIASNVRIDALTAGGATLHDLVASGASSRLARHDIVVLQEQSEIPGFDSDTDPYLASLSAVDHIARAATAVRAQVILMETWARQNGDPANEAIYPTYDAMQTRILQGYTGYIDELRAGSAPDAELSRVGSAWAWLQVHEPGQFASLYGPDGAHPSSVGTYLAALVLAQTINRDRLPAHPWKPSTVTEAQAAALQTAARSV